MLITNEIITNEALETEASYEPDNIDHIFAFGVSSSRDLYIAMDILDEKVHMIYAGYFENIHMIYGIIFFQRMLNVFLQNKKHHIAHANMPGKKCERKKMILIETADQLMISIVMMSYDKANGERGKSQIW